MSRKPTRRSKKLSPPFNKAALPMWVRGVAIPELQALFPLALERWIQTSDAIDAEAEAVSSKLWHRHMGGVGGDVDDPGDYADTAHDAGIDRYELLSTLRQSALNMLAAWLYHLYEQRWRQHEISVEAAGVTLAKVESIEAWKVVDEARLVANVVKHGEGKSARILRNQRLELFRNPVLARFRSVKVRRGVRAPLGGDDLYVSEKDLTAYHGAIIAVWQFAAKHYEDEACAAP